MKQKHIKPVVACPNGRYSYFQLLRAGIKSGVK